MSLHRWAGIAVVLACGTSWAAEGDWRAKVDSQLLAEVAEGGQSDFLVRMADSADISAAAKLKTKQEKGRYVYRTLSEHAKASQAGVLAELNSRKLSYQSFWVANTIHATGPQAAVRALAERADVAYLYSVKDVTLSPPPKAAASAAEETKAAKDPIEASLRLVRAPEVWDLGYRGQGVVVGDHDIGVAWEHPALKEKYRGWNGSSASHGYSWHNSFKADPFCTDRNVPCDSHDHGTHTTGTMVGDDGKGNQIGMAPDAKWIACRSLLDPVVGVGFVPNYLECMEWTIAPYPGDATIGADPDQAPDVVNNSWGCVEVCPFDILRATNDAIKAAGIIQVVSAGNDGSECSTIAFPPAIYESSFSVGATDVKDVMASFSSRGPVLTDSENVGGALKPNIVAPGVSIRSSVASGGYSSFSGTSMSGPHVAGLVALILSANPELKGQVDAVREIIQKTAVPIKTTQVCGGTGEADIPNNIFGYGRIDALAAVQAALPPAAAPATKSTATAKQGSGLLLGAFNGLALLALAGLGLFRVRDGG